ncbi:hypothetical protein AA0242T_1205 [Acetobacter aceti NRIC 0242]|uniref:Uncharacterized protein n=1 Tax=Acetobacter aceti NBRC 14818 TaxID=887700 RepID=A0AB33IET3_ACEAC|nr:hypothetical protein EMQ_1109 [Acetobacter aceti NBRC 14818]GAN58756.1 hypothetical protein Abac_063_091 [Acetobacter aceti NBRC 14818]GBO80503.1 hypothetical protein AA0242T_1205 [Acetobacter aceti NRIC 0242]
MIVENDICYYVTWIVQKNVILNISYQIPICIQGIVDNDEARDGTGRKEA